jgi:hypothetical protein
MEQIEHSELIMEQPEYTFDLPALFTDYPMIREPLIRLLDRHTQYVLRFVVKCKELRGMKRMKFVRAQIKNYTLNMIKWENSYKCITKLIDAYGTARDDQLDIIRWLAEEADGIDIQTALAGAARGGSKRIIAYLLGRGAVVTTKTILHAIEGGSTDMLAHLAEQFNGPTSFKITPVAMSKAIEVKNVELAEWLLQHECAFGLKELGEAAALDRRLYTKMRRALKGHTYYRILEAHIRANNTEFAKWAIDRLEPQERIDLRYGMFKTTNRQTARWIQREGLKVDKYGTWKRLLEEGDVSAISKMRITIGRIVGPAHIYAALYRHEAVTQWLLTNAPECKFDESVYLGLMAKGSPTVSKKADKTYQGPS